MIDSEVATIPGVTRVAQLHHRRQHPMNIGVICMRFLKKKVDGPQ